MTQTKTETLAILYGVRCPNGQNLAFERVRQVNLATVETWMQVDTIHYKEYLKHVSTCSQCSQYEENRRKRYGFNYSTKSV